MTEKEVHASIGREKLQRIIEMCTAIENHTVDPFTLDVEEIIRIIRTYFPEWEKPEDLSLDAEALHHLATVIKLQSEWVKHRSTSLYTDPFILQEKIAVADKEEITRVFLKAWHPIVELEQLSLFSLSEAAGYWSALLPLAERWKQPEEEAVEPGSISREELVKQRLLSDRYFTEELEEYWHELKVKTERDGENGRIRYWDFVGADTYEETVKRAFITSFLVTYGYATLEIHPLQEETYIKPAEKPKTTLNMEQLVSIPIAINYDDWQEWRKRRKE